MSKITGRAHTETTFARRDLLKGGGALIVGFSIVGLQSPGFNHGV